MLLDDKQKELFELKSEYDQLATFKKQKESMEKEMDQLKNDLEKERKER